MKKLTFDDLQPHVDMLCDAIENRGASSSGVPNEKVYHCAQKYRDLLTLVREKKIDIGALKYALWDLQEYTLLQSKYNQLYRIDKIVKALDVYLIKEYNKINQTSYD